MKICGIIAEFNPLHHAHAQVLKTAAGLSGDGVVVVMSGNFVQRGQPAVMDKWLRTEAALRCGADLVIELPAVFALAPAQRFALGGIALLHSLGIVTDILFGAETDDLGLFSSIAQILENEPTEFSKKIKENLASGINYPSARERALKDIFPAANGILSTPNNILGVEYLRALIRLKSPIYPHIIKRFGAGYHETDIKGKIASATAIRTSWESGEDISELLPKEIYSLISSRRPVAQKDFEAILLSALRTKTPSELSVISEVCEGLENSVCKAAYRADTLEGVIECIKSKRYTRSRIERIIWKSLLGITQEFDSKMPEYIRILGMNQKGMNILSAAKETALLPIITKPSQLKGNSMFEFDVRASGIYSLALPSCGGFRNEYQTSPLAAK